MNKWKTLAISLLICCLAVGASTTLAYYTASEQAHNVITSGGVKTGEVDPKTMASKKVPGLYFAGEILDCDAYTGGFNLQIAWSTGYSAGRSI